MVRAVVMVMLVFLADGVQAEPGDFNPYAESYVSRMQAAQVPNGRPKLFTGQDKVEDYYRLLEDGYDMLGYSSFEYGDVPPEKAGEYAATLNAAVVLVYTQGIDSLDNRSGRKPSATDAAGASAGDHTLYQYFATYWIKLPMPLLGLHVQRENQEDDAGLEVLAVVKESPAAVAGLQRRDVLTQLGGMDLHKPEQLAQVAQRFAGQTVEVVLRRDGGELRKTVTLNRH